MYGFLITWRTIIIIPVETFVWKVTHYGQMQLVVIVGGIRKYLDSYVLTSWLFLEVVGCLKNSRRPVGFVCTIFRLIRTEWDCVMIEKLKKSRTNQLMTICMWAYVSSYFGSVFFGNLRPQFRILQVQISILSDWEVIQTDCILKDDEIVFKIVC